MDQVKPLIRDLCKKIIIRNPNEQENKAAIIELTNSLRDNLDLMTPLSNSLYNDSGCQPISSSNGLGVFKLVHQIVYGHQLLLSVPTCHHQTDLVSVPNVINGEVCENVANLINPEVCANYTHYWGDKVLGTGAQKIDGGEQEVVVTVARLNRRKQAAELRTTLERQFPNRAEEICKAMDAINAVHDEHLAVIQTIQEQVDKLATNQELSEECLNERSDFLPLMMAVASIYIPNAKPVPCTASQLSCSPTSGCCMNLKHWA